ncbi:ABC transporter ATP-binding protein [Lachnospiraceae bacterium 54-53]
MTELPESGKITLMTFAGNHRYLTGLGCLLSGVSAVIGLFPYIFMWKAVKEAVTSWPDFSQAGHLVSYGWQAVAASLISMLVYFGALMCTHLSAFRTARNMKTVALHHLAGLPVGYFKGLGSGKIRRVIDDGAGQTETYLAHQLPDLAGALITPVAVLFLLMFFDWRFGLISLLPMLVGVGFLSRMMGPKMAEAMSQYQNALEDMNNEAVEYVRGIPVVKTFQQSIYSFKNFHEAINRYKDWSVKYTLSLRIPMCNYTVSINGIFAFLIPGGILLAGDFAAGASYMITMLDLLFYILFTPVCVTMMDKIMWTSESTMQAREALNRILEIVKEKPLSEPARPKIPGNNTVEFCDVTFSYGKGSVPALKNATFQIPEGSTVALVGPSGGGKTTAASLIPRFYDVDGGSITVGGVDVREIGTEELMRRVSFVFQDSHLFKASLLKNIQAARPEATVEEVEQAVKAARCEDIVNKLPQGLHTVVGTKGVYLSGGECQRIALARAILKDAPIVLLDEATAFADPDNEYQIQKAFETLIKGKTVLMIAHRLSTVCRADRILVINRGQVEEQGKHEELLEQNGLYAKMWQDYQTSAAWKVGDKDE